MELYEAIKKFPLFSDVDETVLAQAISFEGLRTVKYKRGDCIFSPERFTSEVGIILSGECDIMQIGKDGSGLEMKKLVAGEGFGILAVLLNGEDFPTYIHAKRSTEVVFIPKACFLELLKNPTVSHNMIKFLAERVKFLNGKIATISAGAVESKLSHYLTSLYEKKGDTIEGFNKQNVAKILGSGRASLYRALSSMVDKGIISIDKSTLKILDIKKLKG